MKLVEFTEYLVKSLVKDPEMVSVKQFDYEDDLIDIQVLVDKDDMGRVVGRGGKNIYAIRTLVQAASYMDENKRVRINVDSF